ncbi:MAG TPA: tRNA (guanosine(46)-N7)-methyltransferase TrmB [Acidobacteriota bacterium]|nr:tRNA (guanosine(46)-N7)-methyltransferase TrmB [Acidobacteriota bacterium]HQG90490.1 tRNA (guanosine(46)-N7)-methyltransferase TrmB [Acidobacteriota bacterium]
MSRSHDRPARAVSASLSLSPLVAAYLVTLNGLAEAGGWAGLFGRAAPLELEIGFGWDTFLLEQAKTRTTTDFVGIEYDRQRVLALARKAAAAGVNNLRLVWGDALYHLPRLFPPASLRRVYIRFPDPWPKKRHHKHRLLGPEFLRSLFWHIAEGGELLVATDDAEYRDFIHDSLGAVVGLHNTAAPRPWLDSAPDLPMSKFEILFRTQGKNVFFFRYARGAGFASAHVVAATEKLSRIPRRVSEMPHVVFSNALELDALNRAFKPFCWREDEVLFKVNELWMASRASAVLLECVIVHDGHDECFYVEVANKQAGAVIRVSPIKEAERTELVFRCLAGIARRFLSSFPDLRVARHNLGAWAPVGIDGQHRPDVFWIERNHGSEPTSVE